MKVESIVDYAKRHLESWIITGRFRPGQRIKEEEVAAQLGVSRPPIREAFKVLEAEGLVTRRPRRGVFVTEITPQDIWEIYTLKTALYGLATELAMERMDKRTLMRLERTLERMESCIKKRPPDVQRYQDLHEAFHRIIMEVTGHQRLLRIVSSLHNQVKRYSYRSLGYGDHLQESYDYHRRIYEAFRQGDRQRAEELTREHILRGLEILQEMVGGEAFQALVAEAGLQKG